MYKNFLMLFLTEHLVSNMWPYTDEEWNTLTYGIKRRIKRSKTILWMSAIPSITLIGLLIYVLSN